MPENLPILLVPGLNCSARLYAPQIPELWRLGPVTVADHTGADTMAGIVRQILAVAPPRFAYIGLSMGGYIAFELMRQAPERVARLALLDTRADGDTPEGAALRHKRIALAAGGQFEQVIEETWPALVHPGRRSDAELKAIHVAMCRDVGAYGYVRQHKAVVGRVDSLPSLSAIRCPTLILVGAQDELTTPADAKEMAKRIPGSRMIEIPDCGHLSTLERPEAVTKELLTFLSS